MAKYQSELKENLSEERAIDTVGRPGIKQKSYGKVGGEVGGKSEKKGMGGSAKGVGGFRGDNTQEEPVQHEASYRTDGKDKNYEKKPESGLPRQEAAYQNRDRQGSGLVNEPKYQQKLRSYPTGNPKTKKSKTEDD